MLNPNCQCCGGRWEVEGRRPEFCTSFSRGERPFDTTTKRINGFSVLRIGFLSGFYQGFRVLGRLRVSRISTGLAEYVMLQVEILQGLSGDTRTTNPLNPELQAPSS